MIGGLVLAGGGGSRFGGGKLLAELDGRPLVEYPIAALTEAGVERVVLVVGADEERIREEADTGDAKLVVADDWEDGQAESLKAGIQALGDAEAVVVLLGDQPLISGAAIERVLEAREVGAEVVRATYGGLAAHPTVFERSALPRLLELEGDVGARQIVTELRVREVACDDVADPLDVDTPTDLDRARAKLAEGT